MPVCFLLSSFAFQVSAQKPKTKTAESSQPFVLGIIDKIQSKELDEERILNIYFPEGYNKNDTITYPVTYLLDGSADEDFIHVVGLYQFNSFEWINRVPKSIVVGIATVDRRRDYTFPSSIEKERIRFPTSGHSEKFIAFIEKELQPFIARKYKANASRTIIGQSLGGLLLTEILFKKPGLFDQFIIVSPSLWWDNGSMLDQDVSVIKTGVSTRKDIYIAVGREGLTPSETPRVMEVDVNLLAEKIRAVQNKNINLYFDYLPAENHATILHQAVFNAMNVFSGTHKPDPN